jgi:myo-inositol-1-phosphate synthase
MALKKGVDVKPATGKLGILLPGMGAVATTFIAGVMAVRRGISKPIGSLTQMGTIRLGKRTENRTPRINDYISLAQLDDIEFGGWDIFLDNAYEAATRAGVLDQRLLDQLKDELEQVKPMPAVFEQSWVKKLNGPNVKKGATKMDLAEQVMDDIKRFKAEKGCDRLVAVWCGSTEVYKKPTETHATLASFEAGLRASSDDIAPSQIYAYACLKLGIPYSNGAPNMALDPPAMVELARKNQVPICGKDFKTGQTLMKTILAPGFKARLLGLQGWYSTNILGNRDGEVLDDPDSSRARRSPSWACSITSCSPSCTPTSTVTSTTWSASTTTRRAATTRKAGTTSTSSVGSATRCRSRSTSSAATRSWRRRSSSTWRCSSTSRSARACTASRSGCRSTGRCR